MGTVNSFAVVYYLRSGLARFVDNLRCGFTPGCLDHAHITVLPPRPISIPASQAIDEAGRIVGRFEPFTVRLGEIDRFESTNVIKLNLREGVPALRTLHDILNTGPFEFPEPFPYVPHVTICKDFAGECSEALLSDARDRWASFPDPGPIVVEDLTFVQQGEDGVWRDLAELALGAAQPVRVRCR